MTSASRNRDPVQDSVELFLKKDILINIKMGYAALNQQDDLCQAKNEILPLLSG